MLQAVLLLEPPWNPAARRWQRVSSALPYTAVAGGNGTVLESAGAGGARDSLKVQGHSCLLITDDYLPHIGGSRIYYHKVATILSPQMSVLTRMRPGAREFAAACPYPILRVGLPGESFRRWTAVGELLDCGRLMTSALESSAPADAYLAGEVNPSAFAAALAGRAGRKPFGVFLHDEPLAGAGPAEAALRRRVLARAAVIITSCTFARNRALEITGCADRVLFAPPGVDPEVFRPGSPDPAVLRQFGVEPEKYLLSVGRLVAYKNIEALVGVLACLPDKDLHLVIVGEGPDKSRLEALALSAGVGARVIFAGLLDRDTLVNLHRGALAYVFPSRPAHGKKHEGIGMAALEAAACGCPVIASTATSAGDFVDDGRTGLLFDPLDPDALCGKITRLLEAPEFRKALAMSGTETVRRSFSWDSTAAAVKSAVEVMVSRGPH